MTSGTGSCHASEYRAIEQETKTLKEYMEQDTNNTPELQSPFGQLREVDADGKEWWNSRKLARVMGYGKYWNFERVIAKAQAWTSQKGYHLGEHFV